MSEASTYATGRFGLVMPDSVSPEQCGEFDRLPYAPTPLNPYDLDKGEHSYIMHALQVVDRLLDHCFDDFNDEQIPRDSVVNLLSNSVRGSLLRRFDKNGNKEISPNCSSSDAKLFADACLGCATPSELIDLLSNFPEEIKSIELAKQSHPFQWGATSVMDRILETMLHEQNFIDSASSEQPSARYYFMRADDVDAPTAAIFIRKNDIGVKPIHGGAITAVQRDSLVIDLAHPHFNSKRGEVIPWLQSEETRSKMGNVSELPYPGANIKDFLDQQFAVQPDERSPSVYPGVRSYYAYYKIDN